MILIWRNFVGPKSLMLYTKFEGYQHAGYGEEDFKGFLTYMDMAAILVIWPRSFELTFVSPSHWCSIWSLAGIGPAVFWEDV